jgi:hypothetical protein
MKNGCHNRGPFAASYVVQEGWTTIFHGFFNVQRKPVWKKVEHVLSTDCRYSILTPNDPGCTGCGRHASVTGGNATSEPGHTSAPPCDDPAPVDAILTPATATAPRTPPTES